MTTKEETLRRIAVMQAWCDGEKIELSSHRENVWNEMVIDNPVWDWARCDYRIAPKPKPKRKVKLYAHIHLPSGRLWMFQEERFAYCRAPWLDGEAEVDDL